MKRFWLKCTRCDLIEPFSVKGRCNCGGTMLVEYDMQLVASTLKKEQLKERVSSMWRYFELLPVSVLESIVSLGEGCTPLIRMGRLERELNVHQIYVKREEQNPTGSFKARGFSSALTILKEKGCSAVAVPSNGNAASALAAYACRAEMQAVVIVPKDCPGVIVEEIVRYGAHTFLIDGLIHDAGAIIEEGKSEQGWFNVGTLREPGRVEGKKTMGLELAEQLGWTLPDVIIYPTGGGSGIIGLWKAFHELKQLNWTSGELPRIVSVQEAGCQPIVDALRETHDGVDNQFPAAGAKADCNDTGSEFPCEQVNSSPTGLRVPNPPDGELIVSILKETNGTALAVNKDEILKAQKRYGLNGISSSPEGAATLAGLCKLRHSGWIRPEESVVLFNTSHADKYLPWPPSPEVPIIRNYADIKLLLKK